MAVNALIWILLLAVASADDGDVCQGEQCAANAEVLLQVRQGTERSSVDVDVEEEANPWEKTMHKFSDQICQPFTGGTCGFWGCDGSRNAQCKKYSFYKFCVCAPGQCAFQGKCIDAKDFKPNPKYADYAVKQVGDKLCQPFTGGTCMTSGCSESRDATCEKKLLCLCGKGKCAMKGKCVDEATFGKANASLLGENYHLDDDEETEDQV